MNLFVYSPISATKSCTWPRVRAVPSCFHVSYKNQWIQIKLSFWRICVDLWQAKDFSDRFRIILMQTLQRHFMVCNVQYHLRWSNYHFLYHVFSIDSGISEISHIFVRKCIALAQHFSIPHCNPKTQATYSVTLAELVFFIIPSKQI